MKIFFRIIILFIITLFVPYFFDKTTNVPPPSDFIYCLGGGFDYTRINKAKELFDKNYSLSNKLIYTGANYYNRRIYPLSGLAEIEIYENLKNTFEEINFLEKYMQKNNLKSVIIITDKYHSMRVFLFIKYLFNFELLGLEYVIVSSSDREFLYTYKNSLLELFKIVFNFIKYNL